MFTFFSITYITNTTITYTTNTSYHTNIIYNTYFCILKDIRSKIKGQIETMCSLQPTLTRLFIQVLHHLTSRDLQILHFLLPIRFFF